MDTILVTGGAGYIGSHACKALHNAGYLPVVFDDLSTGHKRAVQWGPLIRGNLLDETAVATAMTDHAPVAVMHFAGVALVGESVKDPAKYYLNNVAGSANLLHAMMATGVTPLVFSSSCSIFGYVETVGGICDHPAPIQTADRRPGDAARLVADITKASETLDWSPTHSTLDEIVRTALAWENN